MGLSEDNIMKKRGSYISVIALAAIIAALALSSSADSVYTTENDPLVSLSYVQQLKYEIANELAASFDEGSFAEYTANAKYQTVRLEKWQAINSTGVCEIILRSGTAYAQITDENNIAAGVGFSDVTAGIEITNGLSVPKNHCLLSSAGDGRNVLVSSDVAYFLVKGEFSVVG